MFERELDERIIMKERVNDWKEAIDIVASKLLDENIIEKKYVEKIKSNVMEKGAYFIVDHNIVLSHARPEDGVNKNGLSFLKLKEGIEFPGQEGKKLDLIFILSATNKQNHLDLLCKFSKIMDDKIMIEKIRANESKEKIIEIIQAKINN